MKRIRLRISHRRRSAKDKADDVKKTANRGKKPSVVYVDGMCASAANWIASTVKPLSNRDRVPPPKKRKR